MEIKIFQIDKRICVMVDGEQLPEVFSGYKVNSSNSGESELQLLLKGTISVSELSAKTEE